MSDDAATPLDRTQRRWGTIFLVGLLVLLVLLSARLVYIEAVFGARLAKMAARQQGGTSAITARRGMILDARGRVVAVSRAAPDVFVDPSLVDDPGALASRLAARLNRPAAEIEDRIRRRPHSRFVVIAPSVDAVTAGAIHALHNPAVGLLDRTQRTYPLGRSMCHVLGWVGRDGHGLDGVELAFDEHLRGRNGRRTTIRDARRRAMRRRGTATTAPVDGGHLVLTLDAEIQRITEDALDRALDEFHAQSGVAIVLSPRNGDILAMTCRPAYDPSEPVSPELLFVRRNRAITDPVEPGSTIKPVIACGALEGGFVSKTEKIDCFQGIHRFGRRVIRDTRPHGVMDIRGIITHSSNIGMGIIGERMGNAALHDTVRRFGFGERTGIELRGESRGAVYALDRWTSYSTTSIPIGYEILVTPLQLISAFAAIVNDGILVQPRVVKMLLNPDGSIREAFEAPHVVRRAVSSSVARYMARELLTSVVEEGSGRRAKVGSYRVLGKTGTPKLPFVDRPGYEPGAYLGMFVGAAPASSPRIVALALIRRPDPKLGYYGSRVAAPVVGRILVDVLTYLQVPPDDPAASSAL